MLALATAPPPAVSAKAEDPNDFRVDCAALLDRADLAGQVTLGLVSDPADLGPQALDLSVSGFAPVGAFVDSLSSTDSATGFISGLASGNPPPIVASDEEGGTVQRFRALVGDLPSARRQVEMYTPARLTELFGAYGTSIKELGVTMAFAPVVDVEGGPAIGSRSYSDDPAVVIKYAGAVIDGYLEAGITPVLKHFPGHGRASADSHDGAATTPPLDELRQRDLLPYEALLSDDVGVMVGHLAVPGLTDGMPASLSPAAINGLLRGEFEFDGLVVSDALGMGAVRQVATPEEAIVMFLRAGGDLALVDWADVDASRSAVVAAVQSGRLEELRLQQAVNRVLRVKGVLGRDCSIPWKLRADAAARGALLAHFV